VDNPLTAAKIELGRRLFYDPRLSANGRMACADCHQQARGFSDGLATHAGVTGEAGVRNAMALANVGYFRRLTWVDPTQTSLERQAKTPLFGTHPTEMGLAAGGDAVAEKLGSDACYKRLFRIAFPESGGAPSTERALKAIASFERILVSFNAPYDRYRRGDETAMTPQAKRGLALFTSDRLGCAACHKAPLFTDADTPSSAHKIAFGFPDGQDPGYDVASLAPDQGWFRTPSLRNVEASGPYLHDGSAARLEDAIAAHTVATSLRADDIPDLVAFLKALTDRGFLTDPRLGPPKPTCRAD
jgi:cytochrome c peroxidase